MKAADARGSRVLAWSCAVACGLGCGEGTGTTRVVTEGTAARHLAASWPETFASSADKQALILDCLERFVPHAEGFFLPSDLAEARSDWYDAVGAGVTQPRGAGNLALAWVTLLEGRPEQSAFGGVARETLLEHTIQSIRHEALTSSLSGYGYDRWGNGSWQASLEAFSWAFAAWRLWPLLDAETQALVRTVITGEADILIDKPLASGEEGDTGAEDNAWNAKTPALAEVMFPDDPRAPEWHEASIRLALNAVSTAADADAGEIVDGAPLSQRVASVNLHPDLTLENHGFFNPIYQQVTHLDVSGAALAYAAAGRPLPEALSFRTLTIWDEILEPLVTEEGDFAMVAGQDWTSKDYQHVAYLGLLATRFQRADAAALEGRALGLVARRQALSSSGALLGQAELGYESMLVERLAALWWHHHLFGPAPVPTPGDVREGLGPRAPRRYPDSDFVAARLRDAFVSMSWDAARPLALVIPRAGARPRDPIFSYYAPTNLVGGASGGVGPWSFRDGGEVAGGFATAGNIGARRFALVAFGDGVTALLDRGEGPAFNYALEELPGLTGPRPIASEAGQGGSVGDAGAPVTGELSGSWANVAERLGLIVRGGAGMRLERITGEGSRLVLTGSAGTGSGNRGAWLLPLVSSAVTAELDPAATQLDVGEHWAALAGLAPDGSRRLALARWGGYPSAPLELSDPRGAPVPAYPAALAGERARFAARLDAPGAEGQTLRFFVRGRGRVSGELLAAARARLRNAEPTPARVTASHVDANGRVTTLERTLAPAEQGELVYGDGELLFETAPASVWLEPLSSAHPGEPVRVRVAVRNAGQHASVERRVELAGPEGWGAVWALVPALEPGAAAVLELELGVPAAAAGEVALTATLAPGPGAADTASVASSRLSVDPLLELEALPARLPLALGATNQARWQLRNASASELALQIELRAPPGVTAQLSASELRLARGARAELSALLLNASRATGVERLALVLTASTGAVSSADVELAFSEDLAYGAGLAPYPAASASSAQPAYPPALAMDGDPNTFWVSSGTSSGQGPSPERPEYLAVDLGFEALVGSVVMRPRPRYGPTAYAVELSSDGQLWREVAAEPAAPDAVVTTAFSPERARYVRLRLTGSYDPTQPPRNVQVAMLEVRAP